MKDILFVRNVAILHSSLENMSIEQKNAIIKSTLNDL